MVFKNACWSHVTMLLARAEHTSLLNSTICISYMRSMLMTAAMVAYTKPPPSAAMFPNDEQFCSVRRLELLMRSA